MHFVNALSLVMIMLWISGSDTYQLAYNHIVIKKNQNYIQQNTKYIENNDDDDDDTYRRNKKILSWTYK